MSYFRTQPGVPTTTMVTFGAWEPDNDRNIRPGYPVFWESGSAVPLQDAKNVLYTGQAYRPFNPPSPQGTAVGSGVGLFDAFTAYYNGTSYLIAYLQGSIKYSKDGGTTWAYVYTGNTGTHCSFAQYGNCVYATDGVGPILSMDLSAATPTFTALNAATAPVAN